MYKIIRHYFGHPNKDIYHRDYGVSGHLSASKRTIATGLTLEEAQAHCHDPETSSSTCVGSVARRRTRERGAWFDGYQET